MTKYSCLCKPDLGSLQIRNDSSYPLVSIIVPAFNHEKFVKRCLQSLIEDGYPNLEVLVMDDGSTDQTYEVANEWLVEHGGVFSYTYLGHQSNRGIASTLNTLVDLAKGEYITLLASDDFLLPNGIAARIAALDAHPEWLAVIGDCNVVDEVGAQIYLSGISDYRKGNRQLLLDSKAIRRELIFRWCIPGPVLLLRRVAFDSSLGIGKYDESLMVEDKDFYLRLIAKNSLGFIDIKVSSYRVHGSSMSSGSKLNSRLAELLRSLGRTCHKNHHLFEGIENFSLRLYSVAYEVKARQLETENLVYKIYASILWSTLGAIYAILLKLK